MNALDRALRDRLSLAAEEIAARPRRAAGGLDAAPRRTLRPLLAAAALAGVIAGAGTAVGLHHRLGAQRVTPAVTPPAMPSPVIATPPPTSVAKPGPDSVGAAAWDSTHADLVVLNAGGADKLGSAPSATWTWNGSWQLHGAGGLPDAQQGILADMPPLHGAVLVGDRTGGSWRWDGAAWRQVGPVPFPVDYGPDAASYDVQRHQLVVLVGTRLSGDLSSPPAPQTWTWDGRTWRRGADAPLTAETAHMAWDPEARSVVMAGDPFYSVTSVGHAQAWTWTGAAWRRYGSTASFDFPSVRGMAWDASLHGLVAYAEPWYGNANPATIVLAGGRWQMLTPTTFPEQVGTLVEDTTGNRALLVGTAPIALPQTPSAYATAGPETVLIWDGRGWAEATAAP